MTPTQGAATLPTTEAPRSRDWKGRGCSRSRSGRSQLGPGGSPLTCLSLCFEICKVEVMIGFRRSHPQAHSHVLISLWGSLASPRSHFWLLSPGHCDSCARHLLDAGMCQPTASVPQGEPWVTTQGQSCGRSWQLGDFPKTCFYLHSKGPP